MTQPNGEHAILQLIGERDEARGAADCLANALADLSGVDIGEHSSENDPWQNALDAADRLRGRVQAVDRAGQLRAEMAIRFDPGADMVAPRIFEDIARRLPPGVDGLTPPAALVQEFPAELGNLVPAGWSGGHPVWTSDDDLVEQDAWANGWDVDDNGPTSGGAR